MKGDRAKPLRLRSGNEWEYIDRVRLLFALWDILSAHDGEPLDARAVLKEIATNILHV